MSLGWQGESALLPRKAKPINVDSKSMMRLKATILDEQQKLSFRQTSKVPRLRGSRGARVGEKKDVFKDGRNIGLDERKRRDVEDRDNRTSAPDKVTATLAVKAKIYEEMKSGQLNVGKASCDLLINFDEKKRTMTDIDEDKSRGGGRDSNELGDKTKRARCSENPPFGKDKPARSVGQCVTYEWSRGDGATGSNVSGGEGDAGDAPRDFSKDREYSRMIEERILAAAPPLSATLGTGSTARGGENHVQSTGSGRSYYGPQDAGGREGGQEHEHVHMTASSRVKSQWEKTLQGETRAHLESIHRDTERARQQNMHSKLTGGNIEQQHGPAGQIDTTESTELQSTRLQDRKEMLRRKQLERFQKGNLQNPG